MNYLNAGVQNMTHLKQTNILWLEPFILVMEATITGAAATGNYVISVSEHVERLMYSWTSREDGS